MLENEKTRLEDAEEGEVVDLEKDNSKIHFPISGLVLIGVLIVCIVICIIVINAVK
ncbi:MAG: hypothetical protein MJ217_01215 [Bacilli bacterium]|nr:hypothetical protein [Bacilli bacterium]